MRFLDLITWGTNEDFIVGTDDFSDLRIDSAPAVDNFYYFYHTTQRRLVTHFVLDDRQRVSYVARVSLIKKGDKFTPRLAFSVRDKRTKKVHEDSGTIESNIRVLKARVSLEDCYENFWRLLTFLRTLQQIEIPEGSFSLISHSEADIVAALSDREKSSIVNIIKQLLSTEGVRLSEDDINQLLQRKEKLRVFEDSLSRNPNDEAWWQGFLENNKWIFGYGLNYEIHREEQAQPTYGGVRVDGSGGQRGDYLHSTVGDFNFTVLVEIKTPATSLLQGEAEIRNGAWSLSRKLTDAVAQIEANIATWEKEGAEQTDNRDQLEGRGVFTVQPKGIIVIGMLRQFGHNRSKRETFQRFRRSLHGIDILTFDELYERAKFIVQQKD